MSSCKSVRTGPGGRNHSAGEFCGRSPTYLAASQLIFLLSGFLRYARVVPCKPAAVSCWARLQPGCEGSQRCTHWPGLEFFEQRVSTAASQAGGLKIFGGVKRRQQMRTACHRNLQPPDPPKLFRLSRPMLRLRRPDGLKRRCPERRLERRLGRFLCRPGSKLSTKYSIWLWVKNRVTPKWIPCRWTHGLKFAVFWCFNLTHTDMTIVVEPLVPHFCPMPMWWQKPPGSAWSFSTRSAASVYRWQAGLKWRGLRAVEWKETHSNL